MFLQKTISKPVAVQGIGLHTGKNSKLQFFPAPNNTGLHFIRSDLLDQPTLSVKANSIAATERATTLGNRRFSISTVEHCLAAIQALGIDNLFIALTGSEIPIGDGSSKVFLDALMEAKTVEQEQPKKYLFIKKPVFYRDEDCYAYVLPYNGLRITAHIDFPHPLIQKQSLDVEINEESFIREISTARTFGFLKDVENLRKKGLALGGSLKNALVLDDQSLLNPEGLRFKDEFVRHKILDAIGDLANLNKPLLAHLVLHKAGHKTLHGLIQKILCSKDSYQYVELAGQFPTLEKTS